jgi:hypothetical protein
MSASFVEYYPHKQGMSHLFSLTKTIQSFFFLLMSVVGRQETPNSEIWESALTNLSLMVAAKPEV